MNRYCPICRVRSMRPCGKIRRGPRRGFRSVFRCKNCGYQSMQY